MKSPKLTNDENEIVLKKEGWTNLIFGLLAIAFITMTLFFGAGTKLFFKENFLISVFTVFIIITAAYFLIRNGLDRRIKMVVNEYGIWTISKGLLEWSNIQYYYFEEINRDGTDITSILKIKLQNQSKNVKIDISNFNTSVQHIETAIKLNSGNFNIIGLKET